MALEGKIKLPLVGPVNKKTAAYGGAAAAVLVLAIWWTRQRNAAAAAAAGPASGGTVTDPAGNVCSTLNPATGYCPGTLEDQQALGGADVAGAYNTSSDGTGLSGYYYGSGGSTQTGPPGPGNFADNAEWAQYVEAYILNTLGGDPSATASAIGAYLNGQPLTSSQQTIVQEATAYGGLPPASGANGDPPGMVTATGSSGGGTTTPPPSSGGGGTTTPPPSSGGGSSSASGRLTQPGGLKLTTDGRTGVRLQWNSVPHAIGYVALAKLGGDNGQIANGPFTVTEPVANFGDLKPGTRYTALIWPSSATIPGGPNSNQPHAEYGFSTPK